MIGGIGALDFKAIGGASRPAGGKPCGRGSGHGPDRILRLGPVRPGVTGPSARWSTPNRYRSRRCRAMPTPAKSSTP